MLIWEYEFTEGLVPGEGAGAVGVDGEGGFDDVGRENGVDDVGPFNQAEGAAVKIVLDAHVHGFVEVFKAVEVKVIDELGGGVRAVFIDQGECGRGGGVGFNA